MYVKVIFLIPFNRSSEAGGAVSSSLSNHHRKSNSLDAGMGKQVKQQSASRERYTFFFE